MIHFDYHGPSMNPTFRLGDSLMVIPCKALRVGDVVVFQSLEGMQYIVHRVVALDSRGVITRGDNNNTIDKRILRPEEITGQVVAYRRGWRTVRIPGGIAGILYARTRRCIQYFKSRFSCLLQPLYRRISDSGIFRRVLPSRFKPKIVSFRKPDGVEMQLLLGKKVIGRRRQEWDCWQVLPPFRLIVDESSLPEL